MIGVVSDGCNVIALHPIALNPPAVVPSVTRRHATEVPGTGAG